MSKPGFAPSFRRRQTMAGQVDAASTVSQQEIISLPIKIKPGHVLDVTGLDLNFVFLLRQFPNYQGQGGQRTLEPDTMLMFIPEMISPFTRPGDKAIFR